MCSKKLSRRGYILIIAITTVRLTGLLSMVGSIIIMHVCARTG